MFASGVIPAFARHRHAEQHIRSRSFQVACALLHLRFKRLVQSLQCSFVFLGAKDAANPNDEIFAVDRLVEQIILRTTKSW